MRVVTENSVYSIKVEDGGFLVKRLASTHNDRPVRDKHLHFSPRIELGIGRPLVTTNLRTTTVLAILPS